MKITLYDFAASPFCIKVRSILDYKGVEYERRSILSPLVYADFRRRSETTKVPAIELDGQFASDSTEIAYMLDELAPAPPLVPDKPLQAAENHILEDWADESLYFLGLYYRWQEPQGRKAAASAFPRALAPVFSFSVGQMARKQLHEQGTGRKSPEHVLRDLERAVASIRERLSKAPYLLGENPYLCDFALTGQLVYLARTPVGASVIDADPLLSAYLQRMRDLRR